MTTSILVIDSICTKFNRKYFHQRFIDPVERKGSAHKELKPSYLEGLYSNLFIDH